MAACESLVPMLAPFDIGAVVVSAGDAVEAVRMEIWAINLGAVLVTISPTMSLSGLTKSQWEPLLYRKDGRDYDSTNIERRQHQPRTRTLPYQKATSQIG